MILADLQPAIAQIEGHSVIYDLRSITYLSTYPSIRAVGVAAGPILLDRFNQLAAMAYGWMPRIVRIDPHDTSDALAALVAAQRATPARLRRIAVADVAACLHSLVGASKVLHFVNDAVFPIWDSSIETFRLNGPPPHNHMNVAANYFAYAEEVHAIRLDPAFPAFLTQLTAAMNARLTALGIAHYPISEVRAIEAAAFELGRFGASESHELTGLTGPPGFEWHGPKAAANRAEHKVTFEEASTIFGDPLGRITDDPRHSEGEERFVLLGESDRRRLLVVMFTERDEIVHLISARKATRREQREYEEGKDQEGRTRSGRN